MSITGLNPDKCRQRNSIAAKRDGVNSHPIRFLRAPMPVGQGVTSSLGTMPANDEAALALINARQPEGAEALTLDNVWIHPAEAANSSFISDRYAFLSTKTLKNIARNAQTGFAFMNSHRTGDLSHPSELPYGRTIAGRYEKLDDGTERALISFYMLRGQFPNGQSGPSTDALHYGIDGGTIFDVSVGLYGGEAICDVCGGNLNDWDECDHYPGTDYNMTDEEVAAQKARGVSYGMASYTLDDAYCGETSAVYDGAVTGAGFNKVLAGFKAGKLTGQCLSQAKAAYGPLLGKGDLNMPNPIMDLATAIGDRIAAALGRNASEQHNPTPDAPAPADAAANQEEEDAEQTETNTSSETNEDAPAPAQPDPAHPVLEAALAAGITTPDQFAALLRRAEDGEAYLGNERERARKLAVIALGNTTPAQRKQVTEAHAMIDAMTLEQLKGINAQYEVIAEKLGLRTADGAPMGRQSAAAQLPNFSQDAQQPEPPKTSTIITPAEDTYARRQREVEEARRKH